MSVHFWIARERLVRVRILTTQPQFRHFCRFSSDSRTLSSSRKQFWTGEKESIDVKCCSSGSIRVDIFNHHVLRNPSAPLVFFLPPTGTHLSKCHPPIPSYLFSPSSALVRVNYRWNIPAAKTVSPDIRLASSSYHPFPIPFHDILQAWSYILEIYLPNRLQKQPDTSPSPDLGEKNESSITEDHPVTRPILIYGEFLGATLAVSLGLTESSSLPRNSTRITGLIAKQGVYDWLDIENEDIRPIRSRGADTDLRKIPKLYRNFSVCDLRRHLFSNTQGCFDAFASPILFFRTTGILVPKKWSTIDFYGSDPLLMSEKKKENLIPEDADYYKKQTEREEMEFKFTKNDMMRWRSHTLFPPSNSKLEIPKTLFLCREQSPVLLESSLIQGQRYPGYWMTGINTLKQTHNLVEYMRRSISIHEKKITKDSSRNKDSNQVSDEEIEEGEEWQENIKNDDEIYNKSEFDETPVAQETVQILNIDNDFEKEKNLVQEWIEGC